MEFTKVTWKTGCYRTNVAMKSGRVVRINVEKTEVGNASARGGAMKTVWRAQFGAAKAYGDTREAAVRTLADREGFTV